MTKADKLLLRNGFDLKGNKTGNRIEILNKRQKVKRKSKPYIQIRKKAEVSLGEKKIAAFLSGNNIKYFSEYWLKGCYNNSNQQLLYFDFYLPDYNAVIEFDGLHHFNPIYGEKVFKATQVNDAIKNTYCKSRKIPILRIKCFDSTRIENIICEWFDKNF